jgi:hypothetical protein
VAGASARADGSTSCIIPGRSAVQCSAVQCSAVQCSAVQCSAVQRSAVQRTCGPALAEHPGASQGRSAPEQRTSSLSLTRLERIQDGLLLLDIHAMRSCCQARAATATGTASSVAKRARAGLGSQGDQLPLPLPLPGLALAPPWGWHRGRLQGVGQQDATALRAGERWPGRSTLVCSGAKRVRH